MPLGQSTDATLLAAHGWYGFVTSPGFAGIFAVIAAAIAYAAARYSARIERVIGDRAAWWERAQWALELTREDDRYAQLLGWDTLTTLVEVAPTEDDAQIIKNASTAAETAYSEDEQADDLLEEEAPDDRAQDIDEDQHSQDGDE